MLQQTTSMYSKAVLLPSGRHGDERTAGSIKQRVNPALPPALEPLDTVDAYCLACISHLKVAVHFAWYLFYKLYNPSSHMGAMPKPNRANTLTAIFQLRPCLLREKSLGFGIVTHFVVI